MSHRPAYTREDSLGHIPLAELPDISKHSDDDKSLKQLNSKTPESPVVYEVDHENLEEADINDSTEKVMETPLDFSTKLVSVTDDPTLPIWTFRMWFLGIGFTAFAAVLGQIYYFRPQTVYVSSLFITILSFVLGTAMARVLPGERFLGKRLGAFVNPGPFNVKEHVAVNIMSSTAVSSALAVSVFATDELYYNIEPNYGVAIFALIASQLLGYGLAGMTRSFTVFPTYALWPASFAYTQLFETLHSKHEAGAMKKRWKFFWTLLAIVFVWEWFPEYIAPTLTGVSIVCLARQDSAWVTRLFGGSNGNEGFGIFSMSFDWYYVGSAPFYTPLLTQQNQWFGIGLCILVNSIAYSTNMWEAKNFPWLSQELFYENGTTYDQTLILGPTYDLNQTALEIQGVPWFSMTNALYYAGNNLTIGSQVSFVALFYYPQIIEAWKAFREKRQNDPHYQQMLVYKEVPMWWYGLTFLGSFAAAMATCYTGHSQLPWWGLIVAILLSTIIMPFYAVIYAVTGFGQGFGGVAQLIGGVMIPGNPQTNLWFTLYGSTVGDQAVAMCSDLKLGQYMKLPPRVTFTVQMLGSVIGGILQIIITKTIVNNQRAILLSVEGTNIWSGQNVQSYNSQAISWGALAQPMYGSGSTYEIIPICIAIGFALPFFLFAGHKFRPTWGFDKVIVPIIMWHLGYLSVGVNSSVFFSILAGAISQLYIRRKRPGWFRKYNYLMCGAIDGGYQFMSFIATFAVFGGAGTPIAFPNWALNPANKNYDYCMYLAS